MEVKALVSVDTWPVHPVEYTLPSGTVCSGLMVCKGRRAGAGLCYIITETGSSITVPEHSVKVIQSTARIHITINVLEK